MVVLAIGIGPCHSGQYHSRGRVKSSTTTSNSTDHGHGFVYMLPVSI